MQILLAKNHGFCSGVKNAVETALSVDPSNTYVLGELIHNAEVVRRISDRGIRTVSSLDEVPDGAVLLIRSHGVGKSVYDACGARNICIVDCTCPFVKRTQEIVERESGQGRCIAIAGHGEHPEVQGLVGWCSTEAFVFSSEEDDFSPIAEKDVVLVSQTTFSEGRFSKIAQKLKKECQKTVEIFGTICYTTVSRQKEAERLAGISDAVLVIGGANSSNTSKLCEIAAAHCGRVFRLTCADDFKYQQVKFCKRVGVIAGASTPDWQTREVLCKMAENNAEVHETTEVVEEAAAPVEEVTAEETVAPAEEVAAETAAPAEAVEAAPAEQSAEVAEAPAAQPAEVPEAPVAHKSAMDALMEEGEKQPYRKGTIIKVTIVQADDEKIFVSGDGKVENVIEKDELDCESYSREEYAAKVGEEIEVMVVSVNPVKLSQRLVKKKKEEEALLESIADGKEFSVVCTGYNKGGLTAELGTYPVFVPAGQIRPGYVKDLEKYTGKKLRLKLMEIRKGKGNYGKEIIASQRVILEEEQKAREAARAEREEAFFDSIEVDAIVEGKVERVTNFGAFVSVNGFDCLAHISDLSWAGVKSVTDVLEIGKRYQFKVLKVDRENKKVSIGYKQLQPQPWDLAAEKYAEGDIIHGKVVRIVPFGAFVEIEKGIDGLVHVSQISHEWLENPTSVLSIGEEVDAKILAFSPAEHKITLSIKALQPRPEYEPRPERSENNKQQQRGKKGGRRNVSPEEEDEYREWNEGGYGGVSIADLLGNDKK